MDIIPGDGISGTYVKFREGICMHTTYNVLGAIIFYQIVLFPNGNIEPGSQVAMAFEIIPGREPDYNAICAMMKLDEDEKTELKNRWSEVMDA